ncbi:histidine phosphatase family protein [Rubrivivax albus]|uniref:Histidine phosphatase family protein n=1 Tax=Rubrivivax albus TaxID=2499835 RepID=A0A437JXB7_9BURK|nr:histidine phosphatase family protein [Rubrivivax albus]RVT52324.1 histidine phosphatase family protein [Rubrivivax albus]
MTILWLRHGETALNAARVVQPADTPLSPRGLAQAAAAAARIATLQPVALLSSDMPRALQTAQAVAAATGLPVRTDPLLQERNFGALRGRAWSTLGFDPMLLEDAPEGGESMAGFHARVARAWARALAERQAADGLLVVVSHGLLIHAALQRHAHWPGGIMALPPRLANTSVSEVAAEAPHAVLRVDCTAHLVDPEAIGASDGAAA